ncbi:ATP-dependent Lon protease [Bacillus sp. S/N-304-OC-R1]|uniref:ATP-dependent Lon protease n=1 Tax=Bacillus sp. S/N-304-OC-R1 TaxID=2758034 RepID=UPI001C8EAD9E|nr:ATP-dependent Lon protease [Bacillus sp. S/N-304-OC-R1]MBY0122010.1 ATP-dependent Lon protease [Bacillus sp. S/N-304-OC-R1]
MKLLLSIILAGLLGLLSFLGPIGIYIICAIITGVIFRSFYLIHEIHKQVVQGRTIDRANEVYENYLKGKTKEGQ